MHNFIKMCKITPLYNTKNVQMPLFNKKYKI
jgi:hypothetical protein